MSLIPISDAVKSKVDVIAVSGGTLAFFKAIPWPELSGCAVFLYTILRIAELLWGWHKKK